MRTAIAQARRALHLDRLRLTPVGASLLVLFSSLPTTIAAENLSRQRPYAFSIAPNYAYCTDPGDTTQLTDGRRVRAPFAWLETAMVGWELHDGDRVGILVDLGEPCRVERVKLWTRSYPRAEIVPPGLLCATSLDADDFTWVGSLDPEPPAGRASRRPRKVTLELRLQPSEARSVLIVAMLRDAFLFLDEIEVHGSRLPDRQPARSAATNGSASSTRWATFKTTELGRWTRQQRRLWRMREALPEAVPQQFPQVALETEERARLARRCAEMQRRQGRQSGAVRVDPWRQRTPWSELPADGLESIVHLSQGDWGALAFDLWSASPASIRMECRVLGETGGAPRSVLREMVAVEARNGVWAGDALPLLQGAIELLPGQVRQVWVDLDARAATLGRHRVHFLLGSDTLSVDLEVHAKRVLQPPPLQISTFTYPHKFPLTREIPREAVLDNVAHGVNSWILAEEAVPWPQANSFAANGHLIRRLDFARSDSLLALHGSGGVSQRIGWYWDFKPEREDPSLERFSHPYASPEWQQAVSEWLDTWLSHLAERGHTPPGIFMQPVDERAGARVAEIYRQLKHLRPDLPLALTLTHVHSDSELRAVEPWIDIAIIERRLLQARPDFVERLQDRGKEIWLYDVMLPSKAALPVESYRMLPWLAWANGFQGCAFWSYAETGDDSGNAWDDFDGSEEDFSVVYGNVGAPRPLAENLVPSKRWQAFRLGVQDVGLFDAAVQHRPALRSEVRNAVANPSLRANLQLRVLRSLE